MRVILLVFVLFIQCMTTRLCAQTSASISVNTSAIYATIDSTMVGFSFNPTYIGMNFSNSYNGANSRSITSGLFNNFYPFQRPAIRINGTNNSYWQTTSGAFQSAPASYNVNSSVYTCAFCPVGAPSLSTSISATDLSNVQSFIGSLSYKPNILWGVNFSVIDTARTGSFCTNVQSGFSTIANLQFELGNEPDLYAGNGTRTTGYSMSSYINDFNFVADRVKRYGAIATPALAKSNPTSSSGWTDSLNSLISSIASNNVATVTLHDYPLGSSSVGTVTGFLNKYLSDNYTGDEVQNATTGLLPSIQTVNQNGLSFRLAECNTISGGGVQGASDVMGSALWAIDMMFELAKAKASGINFSIDGGSSTYYSPFTFNATQVVSPAKVVVNPIYYGALFFARAAQNKGRIISNTISSQVNSPNIKVWAVWDYINTLRLVIINRGTSITDASGGTFKIDLQDNTQPGYLYSFTGDSSPSLQSTSVTLAGQKVDLSTGNLTGSLTKTTVNPSNGLYTVSVPAGTAAMFEITGINCSCGH